MNPLKRKKLYRLELLKKQAEETKPAVVATPAQQKTEIKEEPKLALKETPVVVKEEPRAEVVVAAMPEEIAPPALEQTEAVAVPADVEQKPEVTVVAELPVPMDTKKKKKQ
jgi:hypothetical protein